MDLNQQRLPDEDYQEFKDEISEVLKSVDKMHELSLLRAWVPCFLNHTCVDGQLGHVNSVSKLKGVFDMASYPESGLFHFKLVSSSFHLLKGQGVIGKAFMTNQPFFSTDISSSSNAEDPLSSCAQAYSISKAAVAIPLRSSRNADCILEFIFPWYCVNLEEQMKMLTALFSTLRQSCKTLSVVTEKVLVEKSNSPFPTFQVLQHFNAVEQSDSLFRKENPREADPKHMMQLLPGSSAQNENCSEPTPSIEPTKACDGNGWNCFSSWVSRERIEVEHDRLFRMENLREDVDGKLLLEPSDQNENCQDPTPPSVEPAEVCGAVGLGILAVSQTSGERYATGEKAINVADTSLNDAAQSTKGKGIGSSGSKRHWAWRYCSPILGNINGVICSFCCLKIKGGGITRFVSHISECDPSKNVKKCENVPSEVKAEIDQNGKKRR